MNSFSGIETDMLAIGMPGGWELAVILIVVLLIFGRRIPSVCRGIGSGISEFKKGLKSGEEDPQVDVMNELRELRDMKNSLRSNIQELKQKAQKEIGL